MNKQPPMVVPMAAKTSAQILKLLEQEQTRRDEAETFFFTYEKQLDVLRERLRALQEDVEPVMRQQLADSLRQIESLKAAYGQRLHEEKVNKRLAEAEREVRDLEREGRKGPHVAE